MLKIFSSGLQQISSYVLLYLNEEEIQEELEVRATIRSKGIL
jgi:hypothetical protein